MPPMAAGLYTYHTTLKPIKLRDWPFILAGERAEDLGGGQNFMYLEGRGRKSKVHTREGVKIV